MVIGLYLRSLNSWAISDCYIDLIFINSPVSVDCTQGPQKPARRHTTDELSRAQEKSQQQQQQQMQQHVTGARQVTSDGLLLSNADCDVPVCDADVRSRQPSGLDVSGATGRPRPMMPPRPSPPVATVHSIQHNTQQVRPPHPDNRSKPQSVPSPVTRVGGIQNYLVSVISKFQL